MSQLVNQTHDSLNPIWDLHIQQSVFRAIMESMARPGCIQTLAPYIQNQNAYLAVLASLLDGEVSLHDRDQLLSEQDWPFLQVSKQSACEADYILCDGVLPVRGLQPKIGTLASPDYSATLVIKVQTLANHPQDSANTPSDLACHIALAGPGVETTNHLSITGLDKEWLLNREQWNAHFPLGVDMILVDPIQLISIPRTTQIEDLTI